MKEGWLKKTYWVLMFLSASMMVGYQIWRSRQPSDEEVQRRMQEGLQSLKVTEEVREMEARLEADRERAFGPRGNDGR